MKSDFDKWLTYHAGAYPGFAAWISRNDRQIPHMQRLLGQYSIDELAAATDKLFATEEQPRGYSDHAREIKRILNPDGPTGGSRHEGPQVIDGHITARCTRCMDYGVLEVVSPQTLKLLWLHEERGEHRVTSCMIACDCSLGGDKSHRLKLLRWQDNHALFAYMDVLHEALEIMTQFDSLLDAEWHVARAMLLEHHDKYNKPQELTADALEW